MEGLSALTTKAITKGGRRKVDNPTTTFNLSSSFVISICRHLFMFFFCKIFIRCLNPDRPTTLPPLTFTTTDVVPLWCLTTIKSKSKRRRTTRCLLHRFHCFCCTMNSENADDLLNLLLYNKICLIRNLITVFDSEFCPLPKSIK